MTILSTDLIFFESETPNDETYGGGAMSANVVQDGVSANVFPLIGEADASIGRVQLRKLYAAVLSANTDTLLNSSVNVYTPPDDPKLDVLLFKWGDILTTREEAAAALARFPHVQSVEAYGSVSGSGFTRTFGNETLLEVGDRILLGFAEPSANPAIPIALVYIATVSAKSGSSVTFDVVGDTGTAGSINRWHRVLPAQDAPLACGSATLAAGVTSGAAEIDLNRVEGRVVPDIAPYPSAPPGIASAGLKLLTGTVPIFREGDMVLIRNAAGTTSEVALVSRVDFYNLRLSLSTGLTHSYASGSRVSSLAHLGDLKAQAGSSFSQQTWTRVFSDTIIGNPIGANYNRTAAPIEVTNEGAETERWALVFTNATNFRLIGERFGQIASGSTAADFLPLNPITNQPYFTIAAAGWGTGWQAGNVLRFNTVGARAPFWAMRSITPVPTDSADGAVFQFRGSF